MLLGHGIPDQVLLRLFIPIVVLSNSSFGMARELSYAYASPLLEQLQPYWANLGPYTSADSARPPLIVRVRSCHLISKPPNPYNPKRLGLGLRGPGG